MMLRSLVPSAPSQTRSKPGELTAEHLAEGILQAKARNNCPSALKIMRDRCAGGKRLNKSFECVCGHPRRHLKSCTAASELQRVGVLVHKNQLGFYAGALLAQRLREAVNQPLTPPGALVKGVTSSRTCEQTVAALRTGKAALRPVAKNLRIKRGARRSWLSCGLNRFRTPVVGLQVTTAESRAEECAARICECEPCFITAPSWETPQPTCKQSCEK